jgi:transcription termination factor Rho
LIENYQKDVFPAIDINKSGTRKEELLHSPEDLQRIWLLRKVLDQSNTQDAMEWLLGKMKGSKKNREFLDMMKGGV